MNTLDETEVLTAVAFVYDDGGRLDSGFVGSAGDCVVRSIAIAAELPYNEVYDELFRRNKAYAESSRSKAAKRIAAKGGTPRDGNNKAVYRPWLAEMGWVWTPTMAIGSGTTVHLRRNELPAGRLIVQVSKHVCAVVDGVVHDTHDPSRDGTRAVYGYYALPQACKN